jgi:hypothetical protein
MKNNSFARVDMRAFLVCCWGRWQEEMGRRDNFFWGERRMPEFSLFHLFELR